MGLVIKHTTDVPSWVKYIKGRIRNNKNFICFIGGETGAGKSWTSLSIAEQLDSKFNQEQIVFHPFQLIKLINSNKLKRGSVIVFEEAGVAMSSRKWQSSDNQAMNQLFQTFRHKGYILIVNSPYMDFVDAATRKLFHAEFQMMNVDKEKQKGIVKPQLIQYNGRYKKFYYKYLRVRTKGGLEPIKTWGVLKPTQEIVDIYEKLKSDYTSALNAKIEAEMAADYKKGEAKPWWKCTDCGMEWQPRVIRPTQCPVKECRKSNLENIGQNSEFALEKPHN